MSLIGRIDRRFYPQYTANWDDRLFRAHILRELSPDARILDLGAGAGIVTQMNFRDNAYVCGIDLDPRVTANPMLHEGKIADAANVPYPDGAFDLVFADNVLEHLQNPSAVFSEIARVLKVGGVFLFKTPNRYHYVAAIARLTPQRFHQYVNRLRGRARHDTFPTRYRANSVTAIRHLSAQSGLTVDRLERIEGRPEYLRLSALTYLFGVLYERLVNSSERFAGLRVILIGQLRKAS